MRTPYCNTSTDLFGWIAVPLLLGMIDEVLCSGSDGVATQGSTTFTSTSGVFQTMDVAQYATLVLYNNSDEVHNTIFQIESVVDEQTITLDRKVGSSGTELKYRVTNDLYRHIVAATKRVDALLMDSAFVPFDKTVFSIAVPTATMKLDYQLPYTPTGYQLKITVSGFSGASMALKITGYRESVSQADIDMNPEKIEDSETITFTEDGNQTTTKKFVSVTKITSDWTTDGDIEMNLTQPGAITDLTAAVACERIMRVKFSQSVPNASVIADILANRVSDMIEKFVTGQAGLGHFETLRGEKSAIRTGELFR